MRVIYHPDCLLHDPPYEILSGRLVPYFESPARVECILQELRLHPTTYQISSVLEFEDGLDIEHHILAVHDRKYLEYLRTAYEEWVNDGGDKVLSFIFFYLS